MRRPTIVDIAKAAGVSKGAVSYALNGRPGVSDATRRRILDIAEQLGWAPSSAARSLSDGRAWAIGMVVDRPAKTLAAEPFFMQLIGGIQLELDGSPFSLLMRSAEDRDVETATYQRWHAERRVDGVLLVDLRRDDPRLPFVKELGLPAVVVGGPEHTRGPAVRVDGRRGSHGGSDPVFGRFGPPEDCPGGGSGGVRAHRSSVAGIRQSGARSGVDSGRDRSRGLCGIPRRGYYSRVAFCGEPAERTCF